MAKRVPSPSTGPSARRAGYAKSVDTRARILGAALQEASDSGIHQTSLAAIAARAGVAIGSLNYHFGSREALLRELMTSLTADLMGRLHATDANGGANFFEHERANLLAYLAHLRAHPTYLRLAGEIELHEPKLYRRAVADWRDRIAARLRAGIARGDLRPMHDDEILSQAYFMLGASQFLDHRSRRDGQAHPGDEAVVDAYVALLRGGIAQPGTVHGAGIARAAATDRTAAHPAGRVRRPSRSKSARR